MSTVSASLLSAACTVFRKSLTGPFVPLTPSLEDDLLLAEGFHYDVVIRYDDPLTDHLRFGTHNDFLHFIPLLNKPEEALLWVNHEYFHPVMIHNQPAHAVRTKKHMEKEMQVIGGSIVHIKNQNGAWSYVPDSKYNRRISAHTEIPFQGGVSIQGKCSAIGMVTNCSGGHTPWNTVLTCEENYDIYYGDATFIHRKREFVPKKKMNWYEHFPRPPEHYGWVVEVDPFTGNAKKHTALGRFEHEGATVSKSANGKIVVYMGEDRKGGGIFKFISHTSTSIDSGTLYVANTQKGQWIPLDLKSNPALKPHFAKQLDVLTYASYAAEVGGGTPQDRPEDIEVDPINGNIIVSLTNNVEAGNINGGLLKITEKNGDHGAMEFTSEMFLAGGLQNNFACPDNLAFDRNGNLWMTTDMAEYHIREGRYEGLGNNGLFFIPMHGPHAGRALQVASAPVDAEFTGPTFSRDYKTLFLSVQHPGAETMDPQKPTSTWPDRKGLPKSSVVAISGPTLEKCLSFFG